MMKMMASGDGDDFNDDGVDGDDGDDGDVIENDDTKCDDKTHDGR